MYGQYSLFFSSNDRLHLVSNIANLIFLKLRELVQLDSYISCILFYLDVQINESVQKLLKSRRDVDDALISVVIKNLKIVKVCLQPPFFLNLSFY